MRVLVSGATGMVGTAVREALAARGDEVSALTRAPSGDRSSRDVTWDPAAGTIDAEALARGEFGAVVHLAGEPLIGRWTSDKRERIRSSRVEGTALLASALARLASPPVVLACASATGYYGDGGNRLLTEEAPRGAGFLAEVVEAWEAAAQPARDGDIRTVHLRMGVVLSPRGGGLQKLVQVFRLGVGGPIGNGRQFASWIGLHEAARIFAEAIHDARFSGVVNAVGPTPSTNGEQARALGRVLHRPAFLPAPRVAVRAMMGTQLADEMLLASQKVVPARLEALGYEFLDRDYEHALRRELERP